MEVPVKGESSKARLKCNRTPDQAKNAGIRYSL